MKKINYQIILLFIFLFINIFLTPHYETNDDFGMMSIVSGLYTGDPSEYIIFQNILMGFLYKYLYLYIPNIHWYPLFMELMQFFAFWKILSFLNSLDRHKVVILIANIITFSFFIEFTYYLQFTKVAFTLSFAGILLIISHKSSWLGGLFLIIASLIRFNALVGATILFLPILVYLYGQRNLIKILIKERYIILLSSIVIVLSIVFNSLYYTYDKGWKAYLEFNKVRGGVHDRIDYKNNVDAINEIGYKYNLSNNDVALFFNWVFHEPIYSKEFLLEIRDNFNRIDNYNFGYSVTRFLKKIFAYPETYIFILLIFLSIFRLKHFDSNNRSSNNPSKYINFSLFFFYYILIFYFISLLSLPHRLYASMMLGVFLAYVYIFGRKTKEFDFTQLVLLVVLSMILIFFYYKYFLERKVYYPENKLDYYTHTLNNKFIIINKSNHFLSNYSLWDSDLDIVMKNNTFYLTGWREQSPLNKRILERNGYETMSHALIDDNKTMINTSKNTLEKIKLFLFEHYNKSVVFEKVYKDFYRIKESLDKNESIVSPKEEDCLKMTCNNMVVKTKIEYNTYNNLLFISGRYTTENHEKKIINIILQSCKKCGVYPSKQLNSSTQFQYLGKRYFFHMFTETLNITSMPKTKYKLLFEVEDGKILDTNQTIDLGVEY